jgi:hypothetical protein
MIVYFLSTLNLFSALPGIEKKEMLLRLPLLSDKNAMVIAEALDTIQGIENIEVCYELKVMIIGYSPDVISDESVILEIISKQRINTSFEKIYSSDIPLIRDKYNLILLNKESEVK